ncbi:hypothetical protein DRB96_29740 [Streptomyces sp. ICC1]|nr:MULTISPECIES: hypothetical protein [unclassified Streptomyces]AWZ03702.1 hypothetical protein DRB89_02585 [Streptomyces sp. ICC4]AWZ15745.1 hypothetical protein DRB96_29740 [Streptomyces sp. ICC1]
MGMTVLYIAFGFVALWLLAEVLMQYKARLRWRLLAFAGFVCVVAGVVLPSVLVIGAGAVAFAIGQTLVTLSFRKGFVAGWALRRDKPAAAAPQNRRRRAAGGPRKEPALQVTALEYGPETAADGDGDPERYAEFAESAAASGAGSEGAGAQEFYATQPVPEETGSYGIQSVQSTAAFASPFTTAEQDAHQYAAYYDPQGQGGYDYTTGYPAPGEQQVYAAYSDPYIGTGGAVAPQPPYGDQTPYGGYAPDPYAASQQQDQQYSMDTPPGGVWVPQQRSTDGAGQPYPQDEQQQYPYQGTGEYEQYRY